MKFVTQPSSQTTQRVRVAITGLALVLILIGLASAIFTTANRDQPVAAIGAPKADVVANMTADDLAEDNAAEKKADESLAELGVTPSANDKSEDGAKDAQSGQAVAPAQ